MYPPYVNSYGSIPKLFEAIQKASVPTKFTQNFMSTVLGLKSSSFRAMIPLLKRLDFIDQGNIPTQHYKNYRDSSQAKAVLGQRVLAAYSDLFLANEYAYKLQKKELQEKVKLITGASDKDGAIPAVVGTFIELVKLCDFGNKQLEKIEPEDIKEEHKTEEEKISSFPMPVRNFGISYTINLNLPATTEIEVFNAIFKSLKEHILNE